MVSSLWGKLNERQLFAGCPMSLWNLLQELGFKWKKDDPRRGLMELPNVALKRLHFLKSYMQLKDEGLYQFVFIDETWIFQNGTIGHSWQDSSKKSVKTTKADGKRFVSILNIKHNLN